MIKVILPAHLRDLAHIHGEVELEIDGPVTQRSVLDALEAELPVLVGRVRDHDTHRRRGFVRFYACEEDLSDAVADGREPFMIVGAMAGG